MPYPEMGDLPRLELWQDLDNRGITFGRAGQTVALTHHTACEHSALTVYTRTVAIAGLVRVLCNEEMLPLGPGFFKFYVKS
jgi:hypothetical protein